MSGAGLLIPTKLKKLLTRSHGLGYSTKLQYRMVPVSQEFSISSPP